MINEIHHIEATVIHSKLYFNQNISSSGGGGYVGPNGGYVHPPTISSTITTIHELFLRLPDNSEMHIKFNKDFQTIVDQKIYLISGWSSKKNGRWIALYNLNTKRLHYNVDNFTLKQLGYYPNGKYDKLLLILHTVLLFAFLYPTNKSEPQNSLGIAFGISALYGFLIRPRIISSYESNIKKQIDLYMKNKFGISFN